MVRNSKKYQHRHSKEYQNQVFIGKVEISFVFVLAIQGKVEMIWNSQK